MGTVQNLLRNFQAMNVPEIVQTSLDETKEEAIGLNQDQLYAGLKSDGTQLPPYRPATIVQKLKKGQPFDRMTLRDTGDFYASISALARTGYLILYAQDEKAPDLVERYGPRILGLGGTFKKDFVDNALRPNFNKKIEDATGLKYG